MSKPLVFLDFDETLFHHYSFIEWFDDFAHSKFGVRKNSFAKGLDAHHDVIDETHRLYRHVEHFEKVTGKNWAFVSAEVEKACHEMGVDFCYPDAHHAIELLVRKGYEPRILTYGSGEYQRFKIRLCPLIRKHNLPIHVVMEPKRDFLERYFGNTKGFLVDDKHPLGIKEPWTHIWLDRTLIALDRKLPANVIHISRLNHIESIILT